MEWILIILLIPSVYFSARFFLLSKNVTDATKNLNEICANIESNRKLVFKHPDKNFERLLSEINKYLEKAQFEKIKFIRREEEIKREIENISHDLRTPLTSIRGYLELMNDENASEEEKKEYISVVERRAKGLQNLIQVFYDLSRLENKEYNLDLEITDINMVLREQVLVYYNDFEAKGINVDISLEQKPIYLKLDKNAIERVFANLIQNAIKYGKSRFKICLEIIGKEVILVFANDTDDLQKEDEKFLFDRFYMKNSSRNNQSSGLGLTITKFLVELMDGEIELSINEGWVEIKIKFKAEDI